jgi:hypothetical protein
MAMALPRMGVLEEDLGMATAGGFPSLSHIRNGIEARRGGAVVAVGGSGSGVVLWWCRASRCLPFGMVVRTGKCLYVLSLQWIDFVTARPISLRTDWNIE